MTATISTIDLSIIGAYFAVVLVIGIAVGLRTKTGEDLFLGGRSLTWGVIGCSLFASNISSTTLIGLTGSAYSTGIAVSNYEWLSGVPLILMAAVFVPIYLNARITTVPEYLELRYDSRSRKIFSLITIVISIVVDTAGGLYAGAVVLKVFFPEIVLWQTSLVLAVFAGAYTAFGGLKAVVYTDTLQALILILGCGLLTVMLYSKLDFSWAAVNAALPPGHLSVIKPWDDPTLPWAGTLVGVPLLGFWYWVTNQYVTQRVLAAKSIHHARWGTLLAGFLKIVPLFIMVLPGAMAIGVLPGIKHPDQVFPTLVAEILPVGAVGIVLAGLISAILSSVDSTLNSASTLIVVDFIRPSRTDLAPRQVAKYGRITTLALMTLAAIWAPMIGHFGGLWSYLQMMFSIIVPPIATVFLVGGIQPPRQRLERVRHAVDRICSGYSCVCVDPTGTLAPALFRERRRDVRGELHGIPARELPAPDKRGTRYRRFGVLPGPDRTGAITEVVSGLPGPCPGAGSEHGRHTAGFLVKRAAR